jgi:anthranilate phosphoribosyltransferase
MENLSSVVQRLIRKEDLSYDESYNAFKTVLNDEVSELEQGALLAALSSKGETVEEIAGSYEAIYRFDTNRVDTKRLGINTDILENSGSGMDEIKSVNVSTAAAVIGAAGGITVAKHGARSITSRCGCVDILEAIGINVDTPLDHPAATLKKENIAVFNGMSSYVHNGALGRILSKIHFGSILNISASLASPVRPVYGVRGVHRRDMLEKTVKVMRMIGYRKGIVLWGSDKSGRGMDEISPSGQTVIMEFDKETIKDAYTIDPGYFNLSYHPVADIAPLDSMEKEKERFLSVLKGEKYQACIDFALINAAPLFYVSGKSGSLREGYHTAKNLLEQGAVWDKYIAWKSITQSRPILLLCQHHIAQLTVPVIDH